MDLVIYGKVNNEKLESLLTVIKIQHRQSVESENALAKQCEAQGAKDIRLVYHNTVEKPDFVKAVNV